MTTIAHRTTIADTLPRSLAVDAALVIGFALLTAAAAQVVIPLGFTPVPITGQTFAVLLTGAALGAKRGALSQGLYVSLGALGLPFYADGAGGWEAATGATAGYLIGFVVAAALIGRLAEQRHDRTVLAAAPMFLLGTVAIYSLGASWLALSLDLPLTAAAGEPSAVAFGVAPFLVGDVIKAAIAAVALPSAWRLVNRSN